MKRIIYLLLFSFLIISYKQEVFAELVPSDDAKTVEKNDLGQITKGYFKVGSHNGSYWNERIVSVTCGDDTFVYCTYLVNGVNTLYSVYVVGENCTYSRNGIHDSCLFDDQLSPINDNVAENGHLVWVGEDYGECDAGHVNNFSTNLPLFNSANTSAIEAYISDGDYSGADNKDVVDKAIADSTESELDGDLVKPSNLKLSGYYCFGYSTKKGYTFRTTSSDGTKVLDGIGKSTILSLAWSIPEDNSIMYDIEVSASFNTDDNGNKTTSWFSVVKNQQYAGDYALFDIVNEQVNGVNYLETLIAPVVNNSGWDIVNCSNVNIRIRHVKDGKHSPWVVLSVKSNGSASAKVTDDDGNVVPDDEYDNSDGYDTNGDDGSSVADTENSTVNLDKIDTKNFLAYIRDGFGLLGNNGIISLLSSVFLFLPNSIWSIFKAYLSGIVVIALFAFFVKVVF